MTLQDQLIILTTNTLFLPFASFDFYDTHCPDFSPHFGCYFSNSFARLSSFESHYMFEFLRAHSFSTLSPKIFTFTHGSNYHLYSGDSNVTLPQAFLTYQYKSESLKEKGGTLKCTVIKETVVKRSFAKGLGKTTEDSSPASQGAFTA